ncbi:energy-coupling factor ABC transporter permease [Eikenella sp. Marseille-P7795]|uniref:energy-coupling factor ABC transporter permease n=1 Tax=Eikenella sp. Marseille-P7795 TaxID=2866577 RepID=UPI001CE3E129|nr:energy-coupling factor ABC transporter permease [Eikenella sp. Marseille-P7795]
MNFPAHWFPAPALLAANVLCLLLFAATLRPALPALRQHGRTALLGLTLAALCWSLRAAPTGGLLEGIGYHLLGVCLLSLMVGIPTAFCLLALLLPPYVWLWQGAEHLPAVGLQMLAGVLPPLLAAALARRLVQKLPRNLFIFIFVNGFFAAAAGVLLSGAATGLLLYAAHAFAAPILLSSVLPVFFLIAWGEAFLTGLLTAIFVALAPQLITTFSDADYLQAKPRQIWK